MASVHVLLPAQRYVFAVSNGEADVAAIDDSADGFRRYKELQAGGRTTGMVAFPNTLLIRASEDYLVDPGLVMQGAPLFGALDELGVSPNDIKTVIMTHLHFDHAEGLAAWPQRKTYVHRLETEAPYAQLVAGQLETVNLEILDGEEGEIEPGVRWIRTPGHCDGLITILVDTDEGLTAIASDCVGPLPEYFDQMDLPKDFGPEREELLEQWRRIRDLDPAVVIPGHNPPVTAALALAGGPNRLPPMEATAPERELTSEKAQRIVDAMRKSVGERGAAGSTFEHVAREAGVSRGLLHYYFGTKERLLVEVVRRDTELRIEMLDEPLGSAKTVDDVLDVLVTYLMDLIENEPGYFLLLFELFSAGRRNSDIQRELGQLFQRTRGHVGEILRAKEAEGVLKLRYDAKAVTSYLFAVGDGFALQALSEPGQDHSGLLAASKATARYLLNDES